MRILPRSLEPLTFTALVGGVAIAFVSASAGPNAEPAPRVSHASDRPGPAASIDAGAALVAHVVRPDASPAELARTDPCALIRLAVDRCNREVRDYRCTFHKQERLSGGLTPVQQIEVAFRQQPLSVYMRWEQNADKCRRALFIDAPAFVDERGQKIARIEPAGLLARLLVPETTRPIHGEDARSSSRRFIDEFGFRSTLGLLQRYNEIGARSGVIDFRYQGEGRIDGRPTFVFVRYLPYTGPGCAFPDAKMVIHIDAEWLLPTAVYSYADREGTELLGSYVYTNVRLNPGLTDADFRF